MAVRSDILYQQLKEDLKSRSILVDASRLMTEAGLSQRYGVAVGTLRKAVARLEDEKLVERQQGRGTFIVDAPINTHLRAAITFRLYCQDDVNAALFDATIELSGQQPLGMMAPNQAETAIQNSDLVFLSNRLIYRQGRESRFSPMPKSLQQKVERDFPAETVDCFRSSMTGELLALPVIANPSVCFLNTGLLKAQGIPMPPHDWTWEDFLELLRQVKPTGVMPFLYLPSSGHFIEPFLRQAGGAAYDFFGNPSLEEKPLTRMAGLFGQFLRDGLAANGFDGRWPYDKMLTHGKAALTICAPHLAVRLSPEQRKNWSYWELPADRVAGGSCTLFGIAVPAASPQGEAAWRYLEENVYEKYLSRLAALPGIFPARPAEQAAWHGVLDNDYVMKKEADRTEPMPFKNVDYWDSEAVIDMFIEMAENPHRIPELRQLLIRRLKEPFTP